MGYPVLMLFTKLIELILFDHFLNASNLNFSWFRAFVLGHRNPLEQIFAHWLFPASLGDQMLNAHQGLRSYHPKKHHKHKKIFASKKC